LHSLRLEISTFLATCTERALLHDPSSLLLIWREGQSDDWTEGSRSKFLEMIRKGELLQLEAGTRITAPWETAGKNEDVKHLDFDLGTEF